jgi:predicted transposase/invertase (TIGR01784 family)
VLYQGIKNDLSFIVDGMLVVVVEHQSTPNPNMPIRFLLYIAELYARMIDNKEFHQKRRWKLLRPVFIVLYNGLIPMPDRLVLKLSDAFEEYKGELWGMLELEVPVVNINPGHNEELLRKSPLLAGYGKFIERVREEKGSGKSLEESIQAALEYCIGADILREFFKKRRKEVKKMILNELTNEYALEAVREDTWEEAWGEAWEEAWGEAWEKSREETWEKARKEAYQQKLESARSFKENGVPLGVIADSLKLPLEVVEGL